MTIGPPRSAGLRILHVVPLLSPDGAYGGPVTVAVNLCRGLVERGHQVTLAGAYRGFATAPSTTRGVPTVAFPARRVVPGTGFAGLASPGLLRWLSRHLEEYDVVHVHLARDLVTMPAAALVIRHERGLFAQTHGMIDSSSRRSAALLDWLLTRRVLAGARRVFYLTDLEQSELQGVARADLSLHHLPNGVPVSPERTPPGDPEALFLARLHRRKQPLDFVKAAQALTARHPTWVFSLVGPDEGEGPAVRSALAAVGAERISWQGPLAPEEVDDRLARASLFVLPSRDEPFPMSVLEAMAHGLPVIVTDTCGIAPSIEQRGAGMVTDGSLTSLQEAMDVLLSDEGARSAMGASARRAVAEEFSMDAVVAALLEQYGSTPGSRVEPALPPDPDAASIGPRHGRHQTDGTRDEA